MPPLVSVLVPSYNHARYLPACLESVVSQTMKDWELILIDDCSTDGSFAVSGQVNDSRFRCLANETNLGTYGTLQRALDLATGRYVAVLNSDDLWAASKLEKQVSLVEKHPEGAFCYTLGDQIDATGHRLNANQHADWPTEPSQEILPYLLRENRILASSVLFRREGLMFHTECRYSGDWLALLERALVSPALCVPEPLTMWRMHDGNAHRRSPGQLEEEIWVREGIHARKWRKPGVPIGSIKASLATNEMHLAALYVLAGSIHRARLAAIRGLGLQPSSATVRRVAATHLPTKAARKRLWPMESEEPERPDRPPLEWHVPTNR